MVYYYLNPHYCPTYANCNYSHYVHHLTGWQWFPVFQFVTLYIKLALYYIIWHIRVYLIYQINLVVYITYI